MSNEAFNQGFSMQQNRFPQEGDSNNKFVDMDLCDISTQIASIVNQPNKQENFFVHEEQQYDQRLTDRQSNTSGMDQSPYIEAVDHAEQKIEPLNLDETKSDGLSDQKSSDEEFGGAEGGANQAEEIHIQTDDPLATSQHHTGRQHDDLETRTDFQSEQNVQEVEAIKSDAHRPVLLEEGQRITDKLTLSQIPINYSTYIPRASLPCSKSTNKNEDDECGISPLSMDYQTKSTEESKHAAKRSADACTDWSNQCEPVEDKRNEDWEDIDMPSGSNNAQEVNSECLKSTFGIQAGTDDHSTGGKVMYPTFKQNSPTFDTSDTAITTISKYDAIHGT